MVVDEVVDEIGCGLDDICVEDLWVLIMIFSFVVSSLPTSELVNPCPHILTLVGLFQNPRSTLWLLSLAYLLVSLLFFLQIHIE